MIAGPSGVGKGTIVRELLHAHPELFVSVSVTTRAPRPDERDGVDYVFATPQRFDRLVADGALLEWAEVFGHRYGTPAAGVEQLRADGKDVILEIDVQGARQVRERVPDALLDLPRAAVDGGARAAAARPGNGDRGEARRSARHREKRARAGTFVRPRRRERRGQTGDRRGRSYFRIVAPPKTAPLRSERIDHDRTQDRRPAGRRSTRSTRS